MAGTGNSHRANPGAGLIHPLLHEDTSDFSERRFSSTFTGEEFFLRDHVVQGRRVLPGAACLEMARAALVRAASAETHGPIRLRNVAWVQPLIVTDQPAHVHIGLFPDGNGDTVYEVYSTRGAGAEPLLHGQGRAVRGGAAEPEIIDIEKLGRQCDQGTLLSGQVYETFRTMGIEYGPAHQGIGIIHLGRDQVLAKVTLPPCVSGTEEHFVLHPSLMDAAIQASLGLLIENGCFEPKTVVPFALDELEILGGCVADMWAVVRYSRAGIPGEKTSRFDIDLCDGRGQVCIRMRGLSIRVLPHAFDTAGRPVATGTFVLERLWQDEAVKVREPVPECAQHLVFLCEPGEVFRDAVAASLPGVRCLVPDSAAAGVDERFQAYFTQVFEVVQGILRAKPKDNVLVQVVTFGRDGDIWTALSGLLKTARLENPRLMGQMIGVEQGQDAVAVAAILRENGQRPQDQVIRYQGGRRQIAAWSRIAKAGSDTVDAPWKDGGVYLLTGGAGGLGLLLAREITQRVNGPVLLLAGRSCLDDARQARLRELEAMGARVEYRQVDVTDKGSVVGLVHSIVRRYGALNGIIHAAGVVRDNFILKKTRKEIAEVLPAKVSGMVNLDLASRNLRLDFFIAFSSIAGSLGNAGQADYAAANAFMDEYASYRNRLVAAKERQGRTCSLNWALWKDGGMRLDKETEKMMSRDTGLMAMETAAGMRALHQALASGRDRMMIIGGDLERLRSTLLAPVSRPEPGFGTLTEPVAVGPGILRDKAIEYFTNLLASVGGVPADSIEADAPLDTLGITSVMVVKITRQLEKLFGPLPITLFFEYQNIQELTGFFLEFHRDRLAELLGSGWAEPVMPKAEAVVATNPVLLSPGRSTLFAPIRETRAAESSDIAIIGLAGRYPQSRNVQEFWKNLKDGKDCITEIPRERWNHDLYFDEDIGKHGKTYSKWGGFLEGVDRFDPFFFNITPIEAGFMDPQERLFLECVFETMEDAGYTRQELYRDSSEGRVGVYVGVMYEEYQLYGAQEQVLGRPVALRGSPSSIANRVSYYFNFHGPSMAVDTMCSSSLTAIHLAGQSLRLGECEVAVAGGVNVSVHPNKYLLLSQSRFVSSHGRCESFGPGSDGYVPGEGVGAVLLKPLSRAVADGDHIYGIIKGTGVNHGGKTNGYTVPNPSAQADVIIRALKDAGVNPRAINYVEAHGTGTSLGDPIEIAGLCKAFDGYTKDKQFCAIGSAKSNIGHCESAAGIAGLTKVLLQLKHRQLVPSLHSRVLNPNIDFSETPFVVQQELTQWDRPLVDGRELPRCAGVSSFGAGGSNAHVVIEEYIPRDRGLPSVAAITGHSAVVVLSAQSEDRLQERVGRLLAAIDEERLSDLDLPDVAYTLQVGREAMEERLALIAGSMGELKEKLRMFLKGASGSDRLYRGHVGHGKDTLAMFAEDEDMAGIIDAWVVKGKYEKIAGIWAKGLDFDWNRLYGDVKPHRISLPTYPFAGERYWVPQTVDQTGAQTWNTVHALRTDASSGFPEARECPESLPGPEILTAVSVEYLKLLVAEETKIPVGKVNPRVDFGELGLDSIMIARLNEIIEKRFGKSDIALFFKHNTIQSLGAHFAAKYPDKVAALKAAAPSPARPQVLSSLRTSGNPWKEVATASDEPDLSTGIAVIGIAGRYPQAAGLDEFWLNLYEGRDCIEEIPPGRWSLDGFYQPDRSRAAAEGLSYSKWGGFLEDFDCFDPLFFNISPRDAVFMDPQERLFLETAWACLEDAGYTRASIRSDGNRVGVFVGATFNNYQLCMAEAALRNGRSMYPANSQIFSIANRISYVMNFTGPSLTVDTACSSSLYAVHLACESILGGRCGLALAGGVNLSLHPSKYVTLSETQFNADDGRCHAFSEGGTGYVPSEGVGAVLLKPLAAAVRDKDIIYGVIKGTAVSHAGKTGGYTVPSPVAQAEVVEEALRRGRIHPRTISCIEAHGTGTALGDPIEVSGLTDAFRKYTQETGFCSISSVKSNIGHSEAAAGIAQLTKVLLQFKHRTLVKNVMHGRGGNPHIDFAATPFVLQEDTEYWRPPVINGREVPRRAGISSFGAGGSGAHIVVEEYALSGGDRTADRITPAGPVLIVLSARKEDVLKETARRLLTAIEEGRLSDDRLVDVAYTLQVGREAREERLAVIVHSLRELAGKLKEFVAGVDGIEHLYRGRAAATKDVADETPVDQDLAGQVELWISNGDYAQLAGLWVSGLDFDWHKLYREGKPSRVSLPTYPFARERYWVGGDKPVPGVEHDPGRRTLAPASGGVRPHTGQAGPDATAGSGVDRVGIKEIVIRELCRSLKIDAGEVDADVPFTGYGVDSINAVQMVEAVNRTLTLNLDARILLDYDSVNGLTGYILSLMEESAPLCNSC